MDDQNMIIRNGTKATFLKWTEINDYKINRRETDNSVTSIKLIVNCDSKLKYVKVPHMFLDNFNKIYGLVYHHVKKNKEKEENSEKLQDWPIVIGLSVDNEKLPDEIRNLVKTKQGSERTLYFETKENFFWRIFVSILSFLLTFGFVMTILDLFDITNFWGISVSDYTFNLRLFVAILLSVLTIGALAFVVVNLVVMIRARKQQLIVTKQGLIEKIFDIVYVIPWKSVKDISTKWFSYGAMNDKGELKIQIIYNEKPKGLKISKETKANRIYNLQGGYHIEPNQLLNMMKEYWKGKD